MAVDPAGRVPGGREAFSTVWAKGDTSEVALSIADGTGAAWEDSLATIACGVAAADAGGSGSGDARPHPIAKRIPDAPRILSHA